MTLCFSWGKTQQNAHTSHSPVAGCANCWGWFCRAHQGFGQTSWESNHTEKPTAFPWQAGLQLELSPVVHHPRPSWFEETPLKKSCDELPGNPCQWSVRANHKLSHLRNDRALQLGLYIFIFVWSATGRLLISFGPFSQHFCRKI